MSSPSTSQDRVQLLIDVGNGRTKFGRMQRGQMLDKFFLPTAELSVATLQKHLAGLAFQQAVLSSVVPSVVPLFQALELPELVILRHDMALGIGIDYPEPASIGADRLANAVALAHRYGAPGVVIDFGTALTLDVVDAQRRYIGGVIAPGLGLMADYLHERTALLPRVEWSEPTAAVGRSTIQAMQIGAVTGYRAMLQGFLQAIQRELGDSAALHWVATGGDAKRIVSGMHERIVVDEDLTLHGLSLVGNLHHSHHG